MMQKNIPGAVNETLQKQFSHSTVNVSPASRQSISKRLIKGLLKLLPHSLETKIKICLHILAESWVFPPAFQFAREFKAVEPLRWEDLFSKVDDTSRFELQEFVRRINNANFFWPEGEKLCVLLREEYAADKIPTPGNSPELKKLSTQLSLPGGEESLCFHQGIALLSEKCKEYLKDKIIIDAGAYIGNYAIPYILNYHPKCVFAFEPNSNSTAELVKNLQRNNIPLASCRIFNVALGDCEQEIFFDANDIRMDIPGNMRTQIVRLDTVESIMEHSIGLIKADVEGMGTELLRGAYKTIEKFRPILALSCYHSATELFGQYEFVSQRLTNYQIFFTALPPGSGFEMTMLAIPQELC